MHFYAEVYNGSRLFLKSPSVAVSVKLNLMLLPCFQVPPLVSSNGIQGEASGCVVRLLGGNVHRVEFLIRLSSSCSVCIVLIETVPCQIVNDNRDDCSVCSLLRMAFEVYSRSSDYLDTSYLHNAYGMTVVFM